MQRSLLVTAFAACMVVACGGGAQRMSAGESAPALGAQAPAPLRVLIIGGTSGIGLETSRLALARGHQVTVMARRPERMTLTHDGLTVVKGDITESADVLAALAGQDAVVTSVGIGLTRQPVSVFSQGTRNVLDAMAQLDVLRSILVTGIGAGDSRGHGGFFYDWILQPLMLKTGYEDKDRAEALMYESVMDWTIVRPGHLTDDERLVSYRVIRDMEGITSGKSSRADVAHFIVAALEARSYLGDTVLLTN